MAIKRARRTALNKAPDEHPTEGGRAETDGGPFYPMYEVASSGLNQTGLPEEVNRFRFEGTEIYNQPNFGLIEVDWKQEDPPIKLEIRDVDGKAVNKVRTTLNTLKPCQL